MASQWWSVAIGRPHDETSSDIQPLSDAPEGGWITLPFFKENQNTSHLHDKNAGCDYDMITAATIRSGKRIDWQRMLAS